MVTKEVDGFLLRVDKSRAPIRPSWKFMKATTLSMKAAYRRSASSMDFPALVDTYIRCTLTSITTIRSFRLMPSRCLSTRVCMVGIQPQVRLHGYRLFAFATEDTFHSEENVFSVEDFILQKL